MPKIRCSSCSEYVDRDGALRGGVQSFCNEKCRRDKQSAREATRAAGRGSRTKQRKSADPMPPGVRDAVIASDSGRCRMCGTGSGLHVHHVLYRSEGGKNLAENLITLCFKCHDVVHSDKKIWQPACLLLINRRQERGDKHSRLIRFVGVGDDGAG